MQGLPQFMIDRQLNCLAKVDSVYVAEVAKVLATNVNLWHGIDLQLSLDWAVGGFSEHL
jgi:hypothetical protein